MFRTQSMGRENCSKEAGGYIQVCNRRSRQSEHQRSGIKLRKFCILCMGRCKLLGLLLKSFLPYVAHLSGASILFFDIITSLVPRSSWGKACPTPAPCPAVSKSRAWPFCRTTAARESNRDCRHWRVLAVFSMDTAMSVKSCWNLCKEVPMVQHLSNQQSVLMPEKWG